MGVLEVRPRSREETDSWFEGEQARRRRQRPGLSEIEPAAVPAQLDTRASRGKSCFAAYHAAGRQMVGLSTGSRTGALTLYRRIGMRVRRTYTSWAKDLGAR